MSSDLLSSALRIIRSPHFWGVLVIFAIGFILHYPEQLTPWGATNISSLLGLTRKTAERVFFLIPITYASFIFGLRGGIASLLVASFIMIPRAIFISQVPVDAVLESSGIIIVGGIVKHW